MVRSEESVKGGVVAGNPPAGADLRRSERYTFNYDRGPAAFMPSHGENRGSSPLGSANDFNDIARIHQERLIASPIFLQIKWTEFALPLIGALPDWSAALRRQRSQVRIL